MAIDPCVTLNETLETKVSALEAMESGMASQISSVTSTLNAHSASATGSATLTTALEDLTAGEFGAGALDIANISKFTGSCLSGIISGALSADINGLIGASLDTIGSISVLAETAISQLLLGLEGALGFLGIPSLLIDLDGIMGCMLDSAIGDCSVNLTTASNRLDSVLSGLHLDTAGDFDIDDLMDSTSLVSDVKTNLNTMKSKYDAVGSDVEVSISALPSAVPESYF
jgi:hypothetical protein